MSSLLRSTVLPLPQDGTLRVEALACGTNISAAIVCHESNLGLDYRKRVCYLWGSGLPGPSLRVPTPLPLSIIDVKQISCGHTHCGLVTESGMAFTWGAGDHGMLGHGNRTTVMAPKLVASLAKMKCTSISCGAFHTAIIACEPLELQLSWIHIPLQTAMSSSPLKSHSTASCEVEEISYQCGDLYTCGMNKVGQLGLGLGVGVGVGASGGSSSMKQGNRDFVVIPRKVMFFEGDGEEVPAYTVAKVSCGMHHTLMLCVPVGATDRQGTLLPNYSTAVFSCGWGEHGRLGTGDEEQRGAPTRLEFPHSGTSSSAFCAIDIAAGEQHSLAAGRDSAYSWGSNSMGQLGVGSPFTTDSSLLPARIPLPEGMEVKQIAAGGRHSAAITRCGKLLSWGWGEEGQLGGGNEKNAAYPRPVRIPKLRNESAKGLPVAVAVGMSHTVVVLMNEAYFLPPPTPLPVIEETNELPCTPPVAAALIKALSLEAECESLHVAVPAAAPSPPPKPSPKKYRLDPAVEPANPSRKKSGLLTGDDDHTSSAPYAVTTAVRSIRELLQQRAGMSPREGEREEGEGSKSRPHSALEGDDCEPAAMAEDVNSDKLEIPFTFFLTEE